MQRIGLAVFVIFCLLAINTSAQLKSLSEAEYKAATDAAFDKVYKTVRRTVSTETTYKDQKIETIRTLTKESFPNDDSRWIFITKRGERVIENLQIIYLGKYEYRKEGDSAWSKRCIKDCDQSEKNGNSFGIAGGRELPKLTQHMTLVTQLNGKQTNLYHFYRVYLMGTLLNFHERKIWVNSDGLIVSEESTTSDVLPTNITSRETTAYEYDPKDVAPLVAPIK